MSVLDAVRCAAEIQQGMVERNTDVSRDKRIEFRMGIHQGDIIIDSGDIFGDGVNLAARLEGLRSLVAFVYRLAFRRMYEAS
jgi:adenylate cyclase